MTKRICITVLTICFFVMSIVSPVSASEVDNNNLLNVLEYGYPNNGDSMLVWLTDGSTVYFDVPKSTYLYVDFLIRTDATALSVTHIGVYKKQLTVEPVFVEGTGSADVYRVYGKLDGGQYSQLTFRFNFTKGSNVTFDAFYASGLRISHYPAECFCSIETYNYNSVINYVPTDETNERTFKGYSDYTLGYLSLDLWPSEWTKYDYFDFIIRVQAGSINSVSASLGDLVVPCYVSPFDNDSLISNGFVLSIRLDLRGLDRTIAEIPMVHIEGNVDADEANYVGVIAASGSVITEFVDSDIYFFRNIWSTLKEGFQSVVDAIKGNPDVKNDFQENVDNQAGELEQMGQIMDSVEKPDIDSVSGDVSGIVSESDVVLATQPLQVLLGNEIIVKIVLLSLTFCLVSYCLFGKK